jgi:4a-hydroxytetrahydrobiopterin dehydratase
MTGLLEKHCKPCEGNVAPYDAAQTQEMLKQLKGWIVEDGKLVKLYAFRNFHETMAFVNAHAWISHREDHHADLQVGYNRCKLVYWTHAIGGLSENDFICAAKSDALFSL